MIMIAMGIKPSMTDAGVQFQFMIANSVTNLTTVPLP